MFHLKACSFYLCFVPELLPLFRIIPNLSNLLHLQQFAFHMYRNAIKPIDRIQIKLLVYFIKLFSHRTSKTLRILNIEHLFKNFGFLLLWAWNETKGNKFHIQTAMGKNILFAEDMLSVAMENAIYFSSIHCVHMHRMRE